MTRSIRPPARRPSAAILAPALVAAIAVAGCDSSAPPTTPDQAKSGQEAAGSSMDYMRKQIAERKGRPGPTGPARGR
jgi:hypothetical protein